MDTFTVSVKLTNPQRPESRMTLDLVVDTGATWTMLPHEVVTHLGLPTAYERGVTLTSGERVSYPVGQVAIQLNGEKLITLFLSGPAGCLAILGAVTLE